MMNRIWQLPEEVRAKYDVSSARDALAHGGALPGLAEGGLHPLARPGEVMELYAGTEAQAVTIITGDRVADAPRLGGPGGDRRDEGRSARTAPSCRPARSARSTCAARPACRATYQYLGATPKVLPDGWESLGDIGWFDADGYLYLADRRTDMILVGGSNVYPAEIEAALEEHPAVQSWP